jgi:carbon-monoxide dehydrogenase large subunit
MTYDSGDYPEAMQRGLVAAGWTDFPARQAAARRSGRLIGLGLGNYVEGTGRGPFESVSVRIGPSGRIVIATGATDQGQGTHTMLASLAAETFGVAPDTVQVIAGDTAASPLGHGSYASRQTVTAGSALHIAARAVADKAKAVASAMLEVSADDLEIVDGAVRVRGVPGMKKNLGEIAHALSGVAGFSLPAGVTYGICCGPIRLRWRTSSRLMFTRSAMRSSRRSMQNVPCGRPAPRLDVTGARLVRQAAKSRCSAGST